MTYIIEARRIDSPKFYEWSNVGYAKTRIGAMMKVRRYRNVPTYEVRMRKL